MATSYQKRSINGNAGEYFAAFKLTKLFGWPYRMLPLDIGVDAEIEIMSATGKSTSDLIKLQVKTFENLTAVDLKNLYVDDEHLEYWKRFCLPLIILCVDLHNEKIYWKTVVSTDSYKSGGVSKIIGFDFSKDELTVASKVEWAKLSIPQESKEIENHLNEAREFYENITRGHVFAVTDSEIEYFRNGKSQFEKAIGKVDAIVAHFPYRISLETAEEIRIMKRNVGLRENDIGRSISVAANGG